MISPPDLVAVQRIVEHALAEDIGSGDITTQISVAKETRARARIFAKEPGVLAGLVVADEVWRQIDPELEIRNLAADGDTLTAGQEVQILSGRAASLLTGERTALNFIQQLSGVATQARRYVDAVAGTKTQILDTRKTVPGLRVLQKYAVRCGGGKNHRFGLFDELLLKDNHLALFGRGRTLAEAVQAARQLRPGAKVVVEADDFEQVQAIVPLGVDRILLDNMSNAETSACVKFIAGRTFTEASGNMTLERIPSVAATGVDFISVGAITHTLKALDFSLEIMEELPTLP